MDEQNEGLYLTVEQTAARLQKKSRQVYYYLSEGKLRTRKAGRQTLINAEDVERLAIELGVELQQPATGTNLAVAEHQLAIARRELDELRETLGQVREQRDARPTPEEYQRQREIAIAAEARMKALEEQVEYLKLPLWKRLFR